MAPTTFHEYETHFTVMNYTDAGMTNIRCDDWIKQFDEEYSGKVSFADIALKIDKAIKDVFMAF